MNDKQQDNTNPIFTLIYIRPKKQQFYKKMILHEIKMGADHQQIVSEIK